MQWNSTIYPRPPNVPLVDCNRIYITRTSSPIILLHQDSTVIYYSIALFSFGNQELLVEKNQLYNLQLFKPKGVIGVQVERIKDKVNFFIYIVERLKDKAHSFTPADYYIVERIKDKVNFVIPADYSRVWIARRWKKNFANGSTQSLGRLINVPMRVVAPRRGRAPARARPWIETQTPSFRQAASFPSGLKLV